MSAESEINDALKAYAPLTAVVGTRIYPDLLAQEFQPPAIVYQRPDTPEYVITIHDATVHATLATIEILCLDLTRIASEELADLVEDALTQASLQVPPTEVRPVNRRQEYEPESERYVSVVTCNIWPQGATP